MKRIAIVGHATEKFNTVTEDMAKTRIRQILKDSKEKYGNIILVSGRSPMGGIDVWSEEIALEMGLSTDIKAPRQHTWDGAYGFKKRNLDIAKVCDEIHVIVVKKLPDGFKGAVFPFCYHCAKHANEQIPEHIKSGSCWVAWKCINLKKDVYWHVIENDKINLFYLNGYKYD